MHQLLDWINPEELLPLAVLISLVLFVAERLFLPDAPAHRNARRFAAAVFVAYGVLGIALWKPAGAGDLLMIVIRAGMASAAGYGVGLLTLAVLSRFVGDPVAAVMAWSRKRSDEAQRFIRDRQETKDRLERERREREEAARMRPIQELERRRQAEEAARRERERYAKSDEARAEVIGFYQQHADEIADTMPEPLFRTKLQTLLPVSIDPNQAWPAAERLIGEIQTLLAAATATQRERQSERQEATKEIQRLRLLIRREEKDLERLLQSPGYDAEVCEPEAKAMQQRIADLKDELDILENEEARR